MRPPARELFCILELSLRGECIYIHAAAFFAIHFVFYFSSRRRRLCVRTLSFVGDERKVKKKEETFELLGSFFLLRSFDGAPERAWRDEL